MVKNSLTSLGFNVNGVESPLNKVPSFIKFPENEYAPKFSGDFSMGEHVEPLQNTMRLLFDREQGYQNTFMVFVTEEYKFIIMSFNDIDRNNNTPTQEYEIKLWPYIKKVVKRGSIRDVYCNTLNTVVPQKLFVLGCNYKSKSFVLWINIYLRNYKNQLLF